MPFYTFKIEKIMRNYCTIEAKTEDEAIDKFDELDNKGLLPYINEYELNSDYEITKVYSDEDELNQYNVKENMQIFYDSNEEED